MWLQILEITFHFCDADHEGMGAAPSLGKITALGEKGSLPLVFFLFFSGCSKYLHKLRKIHQAESEVVLLVAVLMLL